MEPNHEDGLALRIFNLLSNGAGGLDWSGFDLMVEKFGIDDVDGLIERLATIKLHQPPETE